MFWWAQRRAADPPLPPPTSLRQRAASSVIEIVQPDVTLQQSHNPDWVKIALRKPTVTPSWTWGCRSASNRLEKWPVLSFVFVFNKLPKLIIWLLSLWGRDNTKRREHNRVSPFLLAWKNHHTLRNFSLIPTTKTSTSSSHEDYCKNPMILGF